MSYVRPIVGSDEEDEDGNLTEILVNPEKPNNEVLPLGEVIYLPEDTSCFQPEEEEITDQPVPVAYVKTDVDGEVNSDIKPFMDTYKKRISTSDLYKNDIKKFCYVDAGVKIKTEVIENTRIVPIVKKLYTGCAESTSRDNKVKYNKDQPKTSEKIIPNTTSDKIGTLKADALMPPALKRGNSLVQCGNRKSKYTRQATPICDAIMKEYSKRQKLLKNKDKNTTSDLTDLQIQEILKNAKNTSESRKRINSTSKITDKIENKSTNIITKNNSNEDEQKDPLFILVEREDIKPVITNTRDNVTEVKSVKENITKQPLTEFSEVAQQCHNIDSTGMAENKTQPTVKSNNAAFNSSNIIRRGRGRPLSSSKNVSNNSPPITSTVEDNTTQSTKQLQRTQRRNRGRPSLLQNDEFVACTDDDSNNTGDVNTDVANSGQNSDMSFTNSHHMLRSGVRRSFRMRDNDPNYNPKTKINPKHTRSKTQTSVSSESSTELAKNQIADYGTRSKSLTNVKQTSAISKKKEFQPEVLISSRSNRVLETDALKPRLKILAEKIACVLNNGSSHNIDSEAEQLLQTTQELLKLQKKTFQQNSKSIGLPSSQNNIVQIKQEVTETIKPFDEASPINCSSKSDTTQIEIQRSIVTNLKSEGTFSLQSLNEQLKTFDSNVLHVQATKLTPETYDVQNSRRIDFVNKLQKQHTLLIKHLDETINKVPGEVDISQSKNQDIIRTDLFSHQTQVQGEYYYFNDFFTSHQDIFTDELIKETIPFFSEIVLHCIENLNECLQRVRTVKNLTPENLAQQELKLLFQSYIGVLKTSGEKFFPKFNLVLIKMDKSKTRKALIVTLIFYMTSSLAIKSPTFTKHLHRVRRMLVYMSKVQNKNHKFLLQVLQTSDKDFEIELKLVIEVLKYFQKRKFVSTPIDKLLTNYSHEQSELVSTESSHTISYANKVSQSKNINRAVNINPNSVSNIRSQNLVTPETQPPSLACKTNSTRTLSEIAVEFLWALQSVRDSSSKSVEEKLDQILSVLSANSEFQGNICGPSSEQQSRKESTVYSDSSVICNFQVNVEKPNENLTFPASENDAGLVPIIENEYSGLDSLFESYTKAMRRNEVQIKSEPIDVNDNANISDTIIHNRNNDDSNLNDQALNNIECALQPYFVKQEEEESWIDGTNENQIKSSESALSYSSIPSTSCYGIQPSDFTFYTKMEDECTIIDTFKQDQVTFIKSEPIDPECDPLS